MRLFKKIFGNTTREKKTHPVEFTTPCRSEQELLERYGGIALEKQNAFFDIIADKEWNVDMNQGEISFGNQLYFPFQVLGTFAHASESWLWAWANTQSGFSETIIKESIELKNYGEAHGIDLLRNSGFDAQTNDLHLIGMIASGLFNSTAYYLADYGQGIMVVTIRSGALNTTGKDEPHRIASVFPQLISLFDMNHKNALANYLTVKGYTIFEEAYKLTGQKNQSKITATFDEQYRLTNLSV